MINKMKFRKNKLLNKKAGINRLLNRKKASAI